MSSATEASGEAFNAAVAAALNAERVAAGLTFEGLADLAGISKRTLIRKLSTAERHIDVADLAKLAAVFRMSPHDVLRLAEERMGRGGSQSPERVPRIS